MYVCMYVFMHACYVCLVPGKVKEGFPSPRVTDHCEPSCGVLETVLSGLSSSSDFAFDDINGTVNSVTNVSHNISFYIICIHLLLLLQITDF
ncbi:hypothetical protein I79_003709 [Cricetulus griseus]|uniref:Uncharacterized protein n=1 Tax=Cricetulus griseus TaxID=10029 RepID=G3H0P6_CRIGR|nr:hypothetical protein I79_003709 [Cricetulus griseus]